MKRIEGKGKGADKDKQEAKEAGIQDMEDFIVNYREFGRMDGPRKEKNLKGKPEKYNLFSNRIQLTDLPVVQSDLKKHNAHELKRILSLLSSREPNSYYYEDIKNKSKKELIQIAFWCQGEKGKKKSTFQPKSESEYNSMNEDQLIENIEEIIGREPGTYKFNVTKEKLIDTILTCQGLPKPRRGGGGNYSFTGGGWSL